MLQISGGRAYVEGLGKGLLCTDRGTSGMLWRMSSHVLGFIFFSSFPISVNSTAVCKDYHQICGEWSMRGDCLAKPVFMYAICRASCRLCEYKNVSMYTI